MTKVPAQMPDRMGAVEGRGLEQMICGVIFAKSGAQCTVVTGETPDTSSVMCSEYGISTGPSNTLSLPVGWARARASAPGTVLSGMPSTVIGLAAVSVTMVKLFALSCSYTWQVEKVPLLPKRGMIKVPDQM